MKGSKLGDQLAPQRVFVGLSMNSQPGYHEAIDTSVGRPAYTFSIQYLDE
jgi:hypothetical protein